MGEILDQVVSIGFFAAMIRVATPLLFGLLAMVAVSSSTSTKRALHRFRNSSTTSKFRTASI